MGSGQRLLELVNLNFLVPKLIFSARQHIHRVPEKNKPLRHNFAIS